MTGIRSLIRFGLFAALLLLGVVASLVYFVPARAQEPARGKKYALLVAVDRYEKGSLLPGLPFPGRDIEGLAKLFLEAGYAKDDVIVMTRERGLEDFDLTPTAEHIRNQLGLLLDQLKPGDSVIIGLAGHGVMMLAPPHEDSKGEPRLRSFFCPMDANLAKKSLEKFVSFDELYAGLEASKATTKLLLVDACRNELLANPQGRPGGIAMPPPPPPPASVAALFSCSEKEVSWEDAELDGGHGVFFHYVIEGLKGAANVDGNRNVSLLELTVYTQENVSAFVRRKHATSQLPRLKGDIGPVSLIDVTPRLAEPRTISNSIGMTLTLIKAGEFMMGSDATDADAFDDEFLDKAAGRKEKHRVRITRPFHLGVTEVTRGQFRRFVDDAGYQTEAEKDGKGGYGWNEETKKFEQNPKYTWQNAGFDQSDDHPVVNVSWNDAVAFAQWLSRKEGKTYRLPTEAEWEYACRAGTTTRFSNGDDAEGLAVVGNVADGTAKAKYPEWTSTIAARDGYVYTAPVGRFQANAFGLYDMHGNVWEWCSDGYSADYYKQSPADDPPGALGASDRVIRGGGWDRRPRSCRSADRSRSAPVLRNILLGIRLALVQSVR
jgi:formylglycine-generating enzyme required for sulfatase activity